MQHARPTTAKAIRHLRDLNERDSSAAAKPPANPLENPTPLGRAPLSDAPSARRRAELMEGLESYLKEIGRA